MRIHHPAALISHPSLCCKVRLVEQQGGLAPAGGALCFAVRPASGRAEGAVADVDPARGVSLPHEGVVVHAAIAHHAAQPVCGRHALQPEVQVRKVQLLQLTGTSPQAKSHPSGTKRTRNDHYIAEPCSLFAAPPQTVKQLLYTNTKPERHNQSSGLVQYTVGLIPTTEPGHEFDIRIEPSVHHRHLCTQQPRQCWLIQAGAFTMSQCPPRAERRGCRGCPRGPRWRAARRAAPGRRAGAAAAARTPRNAGGHSRLRPCRRTWCPFPPRCAASAPGSAACSTAAASARGENRLSAYSQWLKHYELLDGFAATMYCEYCLISQYT